jgi:ABC-type Fe3+/spermidine/putrescine transport system ATPase subunit
LALSDRIAVLSHGRIEQIGTPAEIYERPDSAFVAEFIGSFNMLRARIVERGEAGTIVVTETGLRLCCRNETEVESEIAEVSIPAASRADPRRGVPRKRHAGTKPSIPAHRRRNLSGRGPSP